MAKLKVIFEGTTTRGALEGVLSHEILDLKAGTYHKLTFPNGITMYVNDFGVRNVVVMPEDTKAYDQPHL